LQLTFLLNVKSNLKSNHWFRHWLLLKIFLDLWEGKEWPKAKRKTLLISGSLNLGYLWKILFLWSFPRKIHTFKKWKKAQFPKFLIKITKIKTMEYQKAKNLLLREKFLRDNLFSHKLLILKTLLVWIRKIIVKRWQILIHRQIWRWLSQKIKQNCGKITSEAKWKKSIYMAMQIKTMIFSANLPWWGLGK